MQNIWQPSACAGKRSLHTGSRRTQGNTNSRERTGLELDASAAAAAAATAEAAAAAAAALEVFCCYTWTGMTETPAQQDPEPPSGSFEPECGAAESISAGEWVGLCRA